MINPKFSITDLLKIRCQVKAQKPLIHCITNPISINDCANVVLAVGAKPIMAEHPAEVSEITATAKALAVNLGNITDQRMQAMLLSGKVACERHIPSVIDLVGIGCSHLRLDFAKRFISKCHPNVIKGNMSEIRALCSVESHARGIDVGDQDILTNDNLDDSIKLLQALSLKTGAVVAATGNVDIITDGRDTYLIANGCEMLSMITGTGCMLNVLIASFISGKHIIAGTILATALMGIGGEISQRVQGTGMFRTALLDNLFGISDSVFSEKIRYSKH
ncbi:Hydroxyethylthiazole kinase 2 [Propionispora sp. 2/2-37]|uniref:hydroxyethylthiazole kinase n=1 Tax=Propionispora sp. 2/2-37 TaxID=1677858 RepID=UPI0006C6EB46|nr:hydroxyethylthiazole kinase [Propionispora sp. 2/2-37]CUH94704.1 Hydroxyethylthiazole kinase 2 [Propionispora sp. 2/2-37]